jgi:hypothetical protein
MAQSPRVLRPKATGFTPRSISGLALWLDASDASTLYTTDAGPVTAVSSPTDIAGCVGWWDSSDLSAMRQNSDGTGVVAAGDPVGYWADKSSTGAHVTGSGSARPTLSATGFNSRQALVFNGSSTNLSRGSYTSQSGLSAMTRIAVCAHTTNTVAMMTRVTASGNFGFMYANSGARSSVDNDAANFGTFQVGATSIIPAGLYADSYSNSAISFYSSGLGIVGTLNGTIPATSASGSATLHIGSNSGVNFFWNGPIAEYIVFNRALTRAELARVESYLATKWGISGVHTPATATSDPVGAWLDKSGNARHVTQATSASRPTFLPTGISSKPALNFDGTDDNIWRQPGLTSDDLSILMVHQTNFMSGGVTYEFTHQGDTTNSQAVTGTGFQNVAGLQVSATGSPTYMSDVQRSFANVDIQGRSGTAGDITANVPALSTQCVSYSASTSAIRKQAWTSGKGMPNNTRFNCGGWSAITLGARRNSLVAGGINTPSVFLSGRIAEVIAYSRYILDTDRRRLELYLARKWNVTLAGAPTVSNPDAQDWIDRVYGNGGSVSSSTAAAVNTFCTDIDSAGIRDRFFRLNIFAGSNLNACLTPLYLGPTSRGIRYGNTTDTNNAFVGVGTDYAETGASGGLTGNGTSKYLDTGFPMNTLPSTTSGHAAVYCRNRSSSSSFHGMVGVNLAGGSGFGVATDGTVYAQWGAFANVTNNQNGLLVTSRTSTTSLVAYAAGTAIATNSTSTTPTASTLNAAVFVSRNSTVSNTFFDPRTYGFYSIGIGLSAAEVTSLTNAVNAFQSALGRA